MAGPIAGDVRESPLGRERDYAGGYDPSRLYPIARADSRSTLIAAPARGFHGVDWWTAFELSWLDGDGRPQVAVGRFAVPADSPCIVESKSLKLYLGGLYNVAYECWAALEAVLTADLSAAAGAPVGVTLESLAAFEARGFDRFLGICVDTAPLRQEAELLAAEGQETASVRQRFHSHLLRSLCPVTGPIGARWSCSLKGLSSIPPGCSPWCSPSASTTVFTRRRWSGFMRPSRPFKAPPMWRYARPTAAAVASISPRAEPPRRRPSTPYAWLASSLLSGP